MQTLVTNESNEEHTGNSTKLSSNQLLGTVYPFPWNKSSEVSLASMNLQSPRSGGGILAKEECNLQILNHSNNRHRHKEEEKEKLNILEAVVLDTEAHTVVLDTEAHALS